MALLKDGLLPISTYNSLPNIRDAADVPETHSDDLSLLKSILDKYDLSVMLLEDEIMLFGDVHVPSYGQIPVLGPTKPEPGSTFYGSHYFVDDVGELQAWEYMTTKGPDMSSHPAFVKEFCQAIVERGLQHKFGLSLKSSVEEGGWTEFEYPEKRATFLVPDNVPFPHLKNSFNTTTEWPRECFKPVVHGVSYKHCYHCKHPKKPAGHFESEQGASDYSFVEGVSSQSGMHLGGVKLDPATPFFNVVQVISIGM